MRSDETDVKVVKQLIGEAQAHVLMGVRCQVFKALDLHSTVCCDIDVVIDEHSRLAVFVEPVRLLALKDVVKVLANLLDVLTIRP